MTLKESARVLKGGMGDSFTAESLSDLQKIIFLRTSWYPEVIDKLVSSAKLYLLNLGVDDKKILVWDVPGSFELPLATKLALKLQPDFVVSLGCVVRGETPHFDFVCKSVSQALMEIQNAHEIPVGFGLLTVDNLAQAEARSSKGAEAADAALKMWNLKRALSEISRTSGESEKHTQALSEKFL